MQEASAANLIAVGELALEYPQKELFLGRGCLLLAQTHCGLAEGDFSKERGDLPTQVGAVCAGLSHGRPAASLMSTRS